MFLDFACHFCFLLGCLFFCFYHIILVHLFSIYPAEECDVRKLRDENRYLSDQVWTLKSEISRLKAALSELTEKCKPYLEALKVAPKAVKEFINGILERFKKQEKSIEYKPIPAPKSNTQERGKRSKNNNIER